MKWPSFRPAMPPTDWSWQCVGQQSTTDIQLAYDK